MSTPLVTRLKDFIDAGWQLRTYYQWVSWQRRLLAFLRSANEETLADELTDMTRSHIVGEDIWIEFRDLQAGHLEGKILVAETTAFENHGRATATKSKEASRLTFNKVFLVHGHDNLSKESAARFLERLELEVVILHEKANEGRTVIEKFEFHSNVGFAVVLLTPDDIGAVATNPSDLKGRARQNVILELGFFTGSLGRRRVCGLFRPGVEIPSDFHGVLFIEMDAQGGWKTKLAQELITAGMQINLEALLQA